MERKAPVDLTRGAVMSAVISIVPYDARWPEEFREIGGALKRAVGGDALRIDHIGSTAVPGLAAKDVIDIQITVASLEVADIATLVALGYQVHEGIAVDHIPPGGPTSPVEWQKRFARASPSQRPTHIHVREAGRANQRYALLCRDFLRAAPESAEAYARVKMALAQRTPMNVHAYYEVKDPVCDIIIDAAERWATASGYRPGPSDL